MNTHEKDRWFRNRIDRLEVFKGDPPATKIRALRIIETGDTVRVAIRLLQVAVMLVLLNYWR